jgi:hypothetical protein
VRHAKDKLKTLEQPPPRKAATGSDDRQRTAPADGLAAGGAAGQAGTCIIGLVNGAINVDFSSGPAQQRSWTPPAFQWASSARTGPTSPVIWAGASLDNVRVSTHSPGWVYGVPLRAGHRIGEGQTYSAPRRHDVAMDPLTATLRSSRRPCIPTSPCFTLSGGSAGQRVLDTSGGRAPRGASARVVTAETIVERLTEKEATRRSFQPYTWMPSAAPSGTSGRLRRAPDRTRPWRYVAASDVFVCRVLRTRPGSGTTTSKWAFVPRGRRSCARDRRIGRGSGAPPGSRFGQRH